MNIKATWTTLCALFFVFSVLIEAQEYKSQLTSEFENSEFKLNQTDKFEPKDAVTAALLISPELNAYLLELNVMETNISRVSRSPNPVVDFEVENILGSGEFSGFKAGEITALISQEILLAGKIEKRTSIAELEKEAAYYQYEYKRLELITEVRKIFNNIESFYRLINKEQSLAQNGLELLDYIQRLKEKGNASEADVIRVKLNYKQLQLASSTSQSKLDALLEELTRLTGIAKLNEYKFISLDKSDLIIPELATVEQMLDSNPSLVKYNVLNKLAGKRLSYEEANVIPDLTIAAGLRRINEVNENAFVLGISVPIPLFNSNQEGIEEALIRSRQNRASYEAEKLSLKRQLGSYYRSLTNLKSIMKVINDDLLPDARKAYDIAKQGLKFGNYSLHEVLEAQRTILELEIQYCQSKRDFNNTIIETEKIIGQSLFSYDEKELK